MLDVAVTPSIGARGRVPGGSAVGGNFDAGHNTSAVRCGAAQRHFCPIGNRCAVCRRGHHHYRSGGVGAGACCHQCWIQGCWLGTHICEEVHLGLAHPRICWRPSAVVRLVQSPRPLHAAGGEDQGPGSILVEGDVVRGGSWQYRISVVLKVLRGAANRGGKPDEACRPEAIVKVFVRFIAHGARRQGSLCSCCQRGEGSVPPQPGFSFRGGDSHRQIRVVGHVDGAAECIFRNSAAVGWRGKTRIPPRSGPIRRRINLGV